MAKVAKNITNNNAKGVRIKSEKELVAFLNSFGVAKKLKFLASIMLPPNFKFRLVFGVGEDSFTDMKGLIKVGIPKSLIGRTKEEIFIDAKWRLIHEVGHILYTDHNSYVKFIDDFAAYMNTTHGISEAIGHKVGNYLINGLEDGREEAVSKISEPGNEKYIVTGRSHWYFECEIKEVEPGTEIMRELFDTFLCITSLATTGYYAYHYADVYVNRPDLMDMVRNLKPVINAFINCTDPNPSLGLPNAIPYAWQLVYQIETWMVDLMKQIPEPDLSDALDQATSQASASGSSANSSYGSQGNYQSAPQNPGGVSQDMSGGDPNGNNGQDPASSQNQSNDNGGDSQNGGRITRVNDSDDTEYDTDMDEIVEEAMRNAMKEVAEDEYNEVQQASFDDMLQKDKDAAEAEGAHPDDVKAVEDYYASVPTDKRGGRDWAVDYKEISYNYKTIEAETSVKLEAKMLNKEFLKIFLNKSSFDAKNRRRGQLNTNDLYKLKNRDYNIFVKKGNPRDTDFVFYILVDGSGSMGGDKFVEAMRACSVLEESLKGIANVKIVMFDYSGGNVRHRIIKDFKEVKKGNMSWTFVNNQHAGGCNMDGFSIRVAAKELLRRPERRKILFTLSDGQPNGPYNYSGDRGENDVTEAVLDARKNGISVFNIFFAENKRERDSYLPSFRHMYRDKGIVSCAPADISKELLRVVKRELQS